MDGQRPDPDALLAALDGGNRGALGKLKIFIGMAAGSGKTYAMLCDARDELARGVDVVSGYVEPHGRRETDALARGFETLPLKQITREGLDLREFDLECALKRHPKVLLVDELAHTNPSGSIHAKRWQDVEHLLANGIDVYTTVNVQHLESLNDVVASITGVRVRETIPDSLLTRAEKIELVDIPPDELITRLREGKIYATEKVAAALDGFFTESNLAALRELVLRKVADRVDVDVLRLRGQRSHSETWQVRERVLVAIAGNPFAPRLLRAAHRIAEARKADLVVVSVETPRSLANPDRGRLEQSLAIGERMGAQIVQRHGVDIAGEIIAVARAINASVIVVGKPLRGRILGTIFGSIVDDLLRRSGNIDVHLVRGQREDATPLRAREPTELPSWPRIGAAISVVIGMTFICWSVSQYLAPANLNMLYLLGVVVVAITLGRIESFVATVLSVAAFDFFFVPPHNTFVVADAQYLVTFGVTLFVGALLSTSTLRLKTHIREIGERERRARILAEFGKRLVGCREESTIAELLANQARDALEMDVCVYLNHDEHLELQARSNGQLELSSSEHSVAKIACETRTVVGAGTDTLPGSEGVYLPVVLGTRVFGVLGLFPPIAPLRAADETVVDVLIQEAAAACERVRLEDESREASLRAERESTRNILLSAVSHDLRTPLTAIKGSATTLQDSNQLSFLEREELIDNIRSESERLDILVRNVLDLVRLEVPGLSIRVEQVYLPDIIGAAADEVEANLGMRELSIEAPDDLPPLEGDPVILKQLVVNLLENAWKHGGPQARVRIELRMTSSGQRIVIHDSGPGFPAGSESAVFNRGVRVGSGDGFGLGLAICRAIVELHGGSIEADNGPNGGGRITVLLPLVRPSATRERRSVA